MALAQVIFEKEKYHQQQEMVEWCKKNIGPGGWREPNLERWGDLWGIESFFGKSTFYFIKASDATFFKLVWE